MVITARNFKVHSLHSAAGPNSPPYSAVLLQEGALLVSGGAGEEQLLLSDTATNSRLAAM